MKRALLYFALGTLLVIGGFYSGRWFQDSKNGYHYQVIEKKDYRSSIGLVEWTCVSETVGASFLDPEKTKLDFEGRTIYQAQRDFQESVPYAQNVTMSNNVVEWDDGELRFRLAIDEVKKGYRRLGSKWIKIN